jgi:hypothetical protein
MSTPGAKISTQDPKLEKPALVSLLSVAATVMALVAEAGDVVQAFTFEFPAATTTVIPAAIALSTA